MRITTVDQGGLDGVRCAWSALEAHADNIFLTWHWVSVAWRHFHERRTLSIHVVHDASGQLTAVWPLFFERRGVLRLARFVGGEVADELGPVCGPAHIGALADAVALIGADALVAERLVIAPGALGSDALLLGQEPSPVISVPNQRGWEGYLRQRSPNFRQQVRRRERRLQREGITFRLSQDPERLPRDMDALIRLHRIRWGSSSRTFAGAREAFHREFAALALDLGWLRLWLAELRGCPIAAWYGFRFNDVDYFYQSGRDPRWDRLGIGVGLLEHTIRQAFLDGVREYRLLRGGEAYKYRYATGQRVLTTLIVPQRAVTRPLARIASMLAATPSGRVALKRALGRRPERASWTARLR